MSNRYSITFNVSSATRDEVTLALYDVACLIDEHCIVESRSYTCTVAGAAPIHTCEVVFLAGNDAEAADLSRRIGVTPGLPPVDAIRWVQVKRDV